MQVRAEHAKFDGEFFQALKFKVGLYTDEMKNLFKTIDHNASYYSKWFLDAFIPVLVQMIRSDSKIEKRYAEIKHMLLWESEESKEVISGT